MEITQEHIAGAKTVIARAKELNSKNICLTNRGKLVLQIGAALVYYKLGQTLVPIGAA